MSTRLANQGRLIDRSKAIKFLFNGKKMAGFEGDSLAASLLANDQMLVGRSFKYHRPRGIVASGAEEPMLLLIWVMADILSQMLVQQLLKRLMV